MNYYIQGDAANADKIKAAFKELGYNTRGLNFSDGFFYTVERDVHYCIYDYMVNIIKTHPDYKELELPKPHYDIKNFKPFQKVLVRDADDGKWMAAFYSHYMYEEKDYPFLFATIGTDIYGQCIPFEGNEHLLGTTDMCDECYINW